MGPCLFNLTREYGGPLICHYKVGYDSEAQKGHIYLRVSILLKNFIWNIRLDMHKLQGYINLSIPTKIAQKMFICNERAIDMEKLKIQHTFW